MSRITTAVVLAAGRGSRLYPRIAYKPLGSVGGKPLIDRALEGLAWSGIERAVIVVGYGAEAIESHLEGREWPIEIDIARTPDWRLPNGVSARAASPFLEERPALLVMCDHIVDPLLYQRVRLAGENGEMQLGIDRRLGHPWVDPADVTCVRTEGARIVAIGKGLEPHDAYDTGVFALTPRFAATLSEMEAPSLTEGVRVAAAQYGVEAVDCSDLGWIDVDDAPALEKAEEAIRSGRFNIPGVIDA